MQLPKPELIPVVLEFTCVKENAFVVGAVLAKTYTLNPSGDYCALNGDSINLLSLLDYPLHFRPTVIVVNGRELVIPLDRPQNMSPWNNDKEAQHRLVPDEQMIAFFVKEKMFFDNDKNMFETPTERYYLIESVNYWMVDIAYYDTEKHKTGSKTIRIPEKYKNLLRGL